MAVLKFVKSFEQMFDVARATEQHLTQAEQRVSNYSQNRRRTLHGPSRKLGHESLLAMPRWLRGLA